jgi:hypothetical protein
MSNWQDFMVVFYALALAVLGNALLWAVATAFVRLARRSPRGLPPSTRPTREPRAPRLAQGKRLVTGLSR